MQSFCKNSTNADRQSPGLRRALTLLELVVVLAILVILSGMVVPLIDGLGHQANASTNATVVSDINRALGTYATRFEKFPDSWDSLLNSNNYGLFLKLHPALTATTGALLTTTELTTTQIESLKAMGITTVYDAEEVGANTSANQFTGKPRTLIEPRTPIETEEETTEPPEDPTPPLIPHSKHVATLTATALTTNNEKFCLQHLEAINTTNANHQYVVFGLGGMTTIRGAMTRDVPLISSADPNQSYARVLCVFKIPSDGAPWFRAEYVGCFLPDGTSQRMNMDKYNNAAAN